MMVDTTSVQHLGPTIAFVGPNGGGKSTLARRLTEDLRQAGKSVTLTREPGGSVGAEEIRRLVLEGDADRWSPWTETLLFMAARRDHLEKVIWPALAKGEVVISDRYLPDTRVFQWVKDPQLEAPTEALVKSFGIPEAQHTILIDVAPATANERMAIRRGKDADRFEHLGKDIDERVRERFLSLEVGNPSFTVINGNRTENDVYEKVRQIIKLYNLC